MDDNWISVEERLPEMHTSNDIFGHLESDRVLVMSYGRATVANLRQYHDDAFPALWIETGSDGYAMEHVTHWQPLPAMPGEEPKSGIHLRAVHPPRVCWRHAWRD